MDILHLQKLRQFVKHSVLHFNSFHSSCNAFKNSGVFALSVSFSSTGLMPIDSSMFLAQQK